MLVVVSILVLAGCASNNVSDENKAEEKLSQEETHNLVVKYVNQQDALLVLVRSITDYENNIASKSMIRNALNKISKFNKEVKELEKALDEIKEFEFEKKEEFVSTNKEFIELLKKIAAKHSEAYNFESDGADYLSLVQKEDKLEELMNAIYNCGCGELDCDSYKETSMKFLDSSIKMFKNINSKYGVETFGRMAENLAKEKEISEKHLPGLIRKSKEYGAAKCYKINDEYAEYLNELEQVDEVTDAEVEDEVSEKFLIPIENLLTEWDQSAIQVDNLIAEVGV